MSLAEVREELIESVQEDLSVLLNQPPIAQVGYELEEAAHFLEGLGICNLLLYADTDRFYENLVRAGHTRRYFLSESRRQGNVDDHQLAISRWDAYLCVLAAGHFALGRDIVTLSAMDWVKGGEYEDDFCYRFFLHQFIMPPSPERDARLQAALQRWAQWLAGQPSVRMDCCQALIARDGQAFSDAFDALIAQRQAEVAKQRRMSLAADLAFAPRSQIFIEGLALLRLAERLGLPLRPDYPLCPALARRAPAKPFVDDMFPEIDAAAAHQQGQP